MRHQKGTLKGDIKKETLQGHEKETRKGDTKRRH